MNLFEHVVHNERNRANHSIFLGEKNGHPTYMDFTSLMINAGHHDERRGYSEDKLGIKYGPAEAIEIERAREYATYTEPYLNDTTGDITRFNTVLRQRNGQVVLNKKNDPVRGYQFFSDMSNQDTTTK